MENITALIKKRKSVRSYTGEPLSEELIEILKSYISTLKAPFGAKARIEMVNKNTGKEPVKLGTYGVISGSADFFVLINEPGAMSDVGAGYMFEQLILYCTGLNLGTCWLGGTLNRNDFLKTVSLNEKERLVMISPVGYKREKKTLLENLMRMAASSDNRKPFESIFFKDSFGNPLTKIEAGAYLSPLEMVRLAPSASNTQPWRIVMKDDKFHFYRQTGRFSANDLGIALCHFELTCNEVGLKGHFSTETDVPKLHSTVEYVISWIAGEK